MNEQASYFMRSEETIFQYIKCIRVCRKTWFDTISILENTGLSESVCYGQY